MVDSLAPDRPALTEQLEYQTATFFDGNLYLEVCPSATPNRFKQSASRVAHVRCSVCLAFFGVLSSDRVLAGGECQGPWGIPEQDSSVLADMTNSESDIRGALKSQPSQWLTYK